MRDHQTWLWYLGFKGAHHYKVSVVLKEAKRKGEPLLWLRYAQHKDKGRINSFYFFVTYKYILSYFFPLFSFSFILCKCLPQ